MRHEAHNGFNDMSMRTDSFDAEGESDPKTPPSSDSIHDLDGSLTPPPKKVEPREEELERSEFLIRRYQEQGDVGALDEIFRRYYDRVRRKVRVMMSPALRGRVEADDIVNSTFAKAFEIFGEFEYREKASIIHWLAAIAHNKIRDRFRYFNRRAECELEEFFGGSDRSSGGFQIPGHETLPPERLAKEELCKKVDECVARLKPDYRNVILLRDYEGGSWIYVGARMERSDKAAQMLHSRAKIALLEFLRGEGLV